MSRLRNKNREDKIMERARRLRTWAVGISIVVAFVGIFAFPPTRALARQFLSIFRVRKVAVVRIDPDEAQMEKLASQLEGTLFAAEPEMLINTEPVAAGSLEEAQEMAGFAVRRPELPEPIVGIEVKGQTTMAFPVTRESLALILEMADMKTDSLPKDLDSDRITVDIPAMVSIRTDRIVVLQVYRPTVSYPSGVEARLLGEAGLRLLGVPPREARALSKAIDWSNTLVLPVPKDLAEVREVDIQGSDGVLLRPRDSYEEGLTLLWEKDDIVFMITGRRISSEALLDIAESM